MSCKLSFYKSLFLFKTYYIIYRKMIDKIKIMSESRGQNYGSKYSARPFLMFTDDTGYL